MTHHITHANTPFHPKQFIQQATDPNMMRMMLQMQQMGLLPPPGTALPGATGGAAPGSLDFSALLGGAGAGAGTGTVVPPLPGAAPVPVADPATRYAAQLQQLQDMGFSDRDRNLQALAATGGNVNAAIERLLSS